MGYEKLYEILKAYEDAEEYVSANGHKCLRTIGTYSHYVFYCEKAGLSPVWANGLLAEADSGNGWGIDWCERDIILWHE